MEYERIVNFRAAAKYAPTIGTTPSSFAPQIEDNSLAVYGTIVFDFNASSPYELSIYGASIPSYHERRLNYLSLEGTRVRILEPDDGSGWIKIVNDETGKSGLVPATYVKGDSVDDDDAPSTRSGSLMRPPMSHGHSDGHSSVNGASFVDVGNDVIRGSGTLGALIDPNFNLQSLITDAWYIVRALYNYEAQGDDELSLTVGQEIELTAGEVGGMRYGEGWWEGIDHTGRPGIFPSNYVRLVME
jgi:formin-binding protein 1